jgi:site-specific DNA-methyltransferase (adenine-specific)
MTLGTDATREFTHWESPCKTVLLVNGDALEVLPTLGEGTVEGVITDPPYSSGGQFRGDRAQKALSKYVCSESQAAGHYQDFTGDNRDQRSFLVWCSLWMSACFHATKPGGVLCCFSDWRQVPVITDAIQCGGWTWRNLCTWWKPGCRMQKGRFSSSAEFLVYGTAGPHASDGAASPQNVFSFPTMQTEDKDHLAEKPIDVVEWAVSVSREKATILDPFMGSGTTAEACIRSGRPFIGLEIDRNYWQLSVERCKRELDRHPLFDKPKLRQGELIP